MRETFERWPSHVAGRGFNPNGNEVAELISIVIVDAVGNKKDETGRFRVERGRIALRPWSMVPSIPEGGTVKVAYVSVGQPEAPMSSLEKLEALMGWLSGQTEAQRRRKAESLMKHLTSAGYTIERGWCDDMSLAPRDGALHGWFDNQYRCFWMTDRGPLCDVSGEILKRMPTHWRPITQPNGGE